MSKYSTVCVCDTGDAMGMIEDAESQLKGLGVSTEDICLFMSEVCKGTPDDMMSSLASWVCVCDEGGFDKSIFDSEDLFEDVPDDSEEDHHDLEDLPEKY